MCRHEPSKDDIARGKEIEEYYKEIAERSARYEQGQYIDQVESKPSLLVRFWRWLTAVAVPPADKGRQL